MLTQRQREVYEFVVSYTDSHGYPPTVREIGEAVGLASPSTVHAHLANLERAGYLRRDPTKPRALELTRREKSAGASVSVPDVGEVRVLPLVGEIAAGGPLLAEENVEDRLAVPGVLDRHALASGGVRARHACARGTRGDGRARDPGVGARRPRLRRPHLPREPAGDPRAADRAVGGLAARRGLPAVAPRHPPGPPDDRRRGPARLQAHDDPRLRDPLEQLRLLLPGLHRARAPAPGAEDGGTGALRIAAAPALLRPRVHLERGPDARDQRQPGLRRGVPGLPDRVVGART